MNENANNNLPAGQLEPTELNDPAFQPYSSAQPQEDIVSVNKKGAAADNKLAKGIFLLVVGSILVGGLTWFGQSWLDAKKTAARAGSAPKAGEPTADLFNPEKTGKLTENRKIGAAAGGLPPGQQDAGVAAPVDPKDCVRPLRGADGKVMVDPQGQALAVDCDGKMIAVPAIGAITQQGSPAAAQPAAQPGPKPPSRYGGSLFVVGSNVAPPPAAAAGFPQPGGLSPDNPYAAILKTLGGGTPGAAGGAPGVLLPTAAPGATPFIGQPPGETLQSGDARAGSVGSALYSSATPVARAKRFPDQFLMLPKGRQADCILTGRIVDEVPGFTSCVLASNLYSDNGRVLLLERGSELTGEYGVTNQLGSERLFVTWGRIKTPLGIEIDLSSPGADSLGTSGIPGHLDNRWGARLASALLLSLIKDVSVAVIANQGKTGDGNNNVSVASPGQNTANASGQLAEEVVKQTLKVRPRLTINEGTRISIYVARDLDFAPVYALREAGGAGLTRLLAQ